MKTTLWKLFLLMIAIASFSGTAYSQERFQIVGLGGYMLNGDVTVAEGELEFENGVTYGAAIDIPVNPYTFAEINWSMSPSTATLQRYMGGELELDKITIHTFQAGALIEPEKNKIRPFGLLSLGASLFASEQYEDQLVFSIALGLGVKADLSDKVGLRFQGRLIIPMQFAGSSVWFGTGGAGVSMGAYTTMAQGDFMGGLYVRI